MEELHILRATTALRIDIEKERIRYMFSGVGASGAKAEKMFSTASNFVSAAEYGIKTYKIVKKVIDLFRKKKK